MTQLKDIPPAKNYPGMLRYHLGGSRYIQVLGHGKEAEKALAKRVKEISDGD